MEKPLLVWKDGRIVPWERAVVHVASPAVLEGRTVFEEFRCFRDEKSGKTYAFRFDDHVERLRRAAVAFMLGEVATPRKIIRAVAEVVSANEFEGCCVRISASCRHGVSGSSDDSESDDSCEMAVICWQEESDAAERSGPCANADDGTETSGTPFCARREISTCVSSWRMASTESIQPQIRSSAAAGIVSLSRQEALLHRSDEAIILNSAGFVCHSTCGNVFVVRDGVLSTPPLSDGSHDGVLRDAVLNLAMDMDIPAIEERLTRTDLYIADEAFLADDIAGIVPMAALDSRRIGKGKGGAVTGALQKRLAKASAGKLEEYSAWLNEIPIRRDGKK